MNEQEETQLKHVVLSMYAGEPCRICGQNISTEDIQRGAVFIGYSADNRSRSAHKVCFENAKQIFGDRIEHLGNEITALHEYIKSVDVSAIADKAIKITRDNYQIAMMRAEQDTAEQFNSQTCSMTDKDGNSACPICYFSIRLKHHMGFEPEGS